MKKVIIIDDEPLARQLVKECLAHHPEFDVVAECNDGFEGLKAIQEYDPDLIFLDIQMPRINGFELLELLEKPPAVIFTTAFDEYALKAFETHATDYLLKPFSQERFDKAIAKAMSAFLNAGVLQELTASTGRSAEETSRVVLRHQGQIRIIPVRDIDYFEAWDDYVKIHVNEDTFVKKQTLGWYEQTLSQSDFVRVHRSYLVQVASITAIEPGNNETWTLKLKSGRLVPASRSGYARLKAAMGI